MRTLTILTFAAFIAVPTFVAVQSMTAQQYHKEKGPCACLGRRSTSCPRLRNVVEPPPEERDHLSNASVHDRHV